MIKRPSKSITQLIEAEIDRLQGHKVQRLDELCNAFGKRSVALAILLFAMIVMLPTSAIPGFSTIFSLLIILFSVQIFLKNESLWLPEFIARKEISASKLRRAFNYLLPKIKMVERLIKPRLLFMTGRVSEIFCSTIIIFLAILLSLPIPFSNFFYGFFIACFALGLLEQDGLLVLIGLLSALVYHVILFWTSSAVLMALF